MKVRFHISQEVTGSVELLFACTLSGGEDVTSLPVSAAWNFG